ncbi:hypothetical protein C2845_PM05G10980 [Panicum miliaceum]|uniref:Uncharacterized protein n=1 Tax=Panicum miliaceum TaxID=4540 RepID=A0A3L6T5V0_PANMI|nr:hypothetical protein C2845_PM05G10980 [Panicum miliaceum]
MVRCRWSTRRLVQSCYPFIDLSFSTLQARTNTRGVPSATNFQAYGNASKPWSASQGIDNNAKGDDCCKRDCAVKAPAGLLPATHLPPSSNTPRRWPTWVLLDAQTCISGHLANATTAQAATRDGRPIRVTCVVLSPRVSYFCVHRPGLDSAVFA